MRVACAAVAGALLLLMVSIASAQQGGVNFVAEPVPGSHTDPGGGFFLLEAAPGAEVTQAIGLRNDSDGPIEMQLAAVDALTGQRGGVSYALASEAPTRTGTWITLERTAVTLAARASAVVSFRVAVPPGAESGHHLAGISISVPKAQSGPTEAGRGQAGASIDVQTRRVIAVQVNLPGPADPELLIGGVVPVARPDGLYLEVAVENVGRALTKARGVVSVADDFQRDFDVDTFVPRTSITYPVFWTTEARDGEYQARVELRYGDRTARWDGAFTVGQVVLDDLADRQVDPPKAPNEGNASGLPLPAVVGAAVGGAVVVAGSGMAVMRLRRPGGRHFRKG